MGGCATKPKVLKGDEGEGPSPKEAVPEAKEAAAAADQAENKVEADKASDNKDVTDDNIDDQSNKKRSLSNLFKEVSVSNPKENKGTDESDNTQSEAEPMKKETLESVPQESPDSLKQEMEPVTKNQETKEPEKPVEPVSVPPGNIESVKPNEANPAPETAPAAAVANVPETQNKETSAGETNDKAVVANSSLSSNV
ncbi:hypothetical protein V6N13_126749 [Hibiscus sabdariffa]|uniref:Uncharacterized protein n=1 Tax=Hibiscus sabdariffa TaxID=183260 RepID=A0ABR2REJ8_9ROSI